MKIELKNIKHAKFASQETECFEATVHIDGTRAGTVSNEGHGGPNNYYPRELETRLNEYAKTLPPKVIKAGEMGLAEDFSYQPDADTVVGDLFAAAQAELDLKRLLRGKTVFTKVGKPHLYTVKGVVPRERLKDCDKVLNTLPFTEALELYRTSAQPS